MKNNNLKKNKLLAKYLLNKIYDVDKTISATITGSFSEKFDFSKSGDIDFVIICDVLTELYFKKCIKVIKKYSKKILLASKKKKLLINTTFGPIKYNSKEIQVIHLMIYDKKSHTEHTINSPFTCYDWERSDLFVGKKLNNIAPVLKLQFMDFFNSRRGINDYLKDLSNSYITYREYHFKNNKIKLKLKKFVIDSLNRKQFIYHIIKNLIINYSKLETNSNVIISEKKLEKIFFEITNEKKLLEIFKTLKKNKNNENFLNEINLIILAKKFIFKFNQFIEKKYKYKVNLFFLRHLETNIKKDVFLGQKNNVGIKNLKININFKKIKFIKCFSSPLLRCKQTAELLTNHKTINFEKNLMEIDYGDFENLNYRKLINKYPKFVNKWNNHLDPKFPKGENTGQVLKRLLSFINFRIKDKKYKQNSNILIVTHNVVLRCLLGYYFDFKKKDWHKIRIKHCDNIYFLKNKNKIIPNIDRKKFIYTFQNFYF